MRKLSIFILFIVMAVSLCGFIACGDKPESTPSSEEQSQTESVHVHQIEKIAERNDLKVIYDAAHAFALEIPEISESHSG